MSSGSAGKLDLQTGITRVTVHGWLILDKPQGLTSTQALGKVRRILGGKKAGHGGTLDPLATGILPLAFGEATKLIPYVMDGEKEYEFTVRWGEARDTDDAEGKVTATSSHRPAPDEIQNALPAFTGSISQTPPVYSAIKLDGERAYDMARDGRAPELAPRQVTIYSLELIPDKQQELINRHPREGGDPATAASAADISHTASFRSSLDSRLRGNNGINFSRFRVRSGKGMYVRSLARDLAIKLGTCGHVTALRRTRVGPFTLSRAIELEKLASLGDSGKAHEALLEIGMALDGIPALDLTAAEAQKLRMGQGVLIRPQHGDLLGLPTILARHQGLPVAVVEAKAGEFRVLRGFAF